ncbi:MAG: hypothetical protein JWM20_57 [Patescibacteria group bacterium]|nr:hypothetical protein [Patescibacteria group bacterium]
MKHLLILFAFAFGQKAPVVKTELHPSPYKYHFIFVLREYAIPAKTVIVPNHAYFFSRSYALATIDGRFKEISPSASVYLNRHLRWKVPRS